MIMNALNIMFVGKRVFRGGRRKRQGIPTPAVDVLIGLL